MKRVELLDKEGCLHKIIALDVARHHDMWIIDPEIRCIEPVRTVIHEILETMNHSVK